MDSTTARYKKIKAHFEREAKRFDKFFFKVLPFYSEIIDALALAIPFKKDKKIRIMDLGCGTGNITKALKEKYPHASVTCIDLAENMLETAKAKLNDCADIEYWCGDIREFNYSRKYDAIISSLVLHHLEEKDKRGFYKTVFKALNKGGVFYNADMVLASNKHLERVYLEKWKTFMRRSFSLSKINNVVLKRKDDEDRPVKLETELKLLKDVGFKNIDVLWKFYNFAVYGGSKGK